MAAIKLTNVKKVYDNKVTAVHDFNLDIADKEFIVFVGPSGCGKSTTLRMIAGLEEISDGTCEIGGIVVNDLQPKDRGIAMVFQNYALYPHLTVFENIAFPLRIQKQPKLVDINEADKAKFEVKAKTLQDKIDTLQASYQKELPGFEAKLNSFKAKKEELVGQYNALEAECEAKVAEIKKVEVKADDTKAKAAQAKNIDKVNKSYSAKQNKIKELISDITAEIETLDYAITNQINPLSLPYRNDLSVVNRALETGKKTVYVKMPSKEIFERVTGVAETLGITDYLTRKPRALSGGQRQRVAIGRAMVRDSEVLLMDEPLSNLDAKLRNQMRAEIILLRKKINSTFIYVTHDQTEAMTLGDRIVIMKDGFIQQVGTPKQVFEMPRNLFVAEFIGAPKMNIIKTQLVLEDGKYYVTPFGSKIEVTGAKGEALKAKGIETMDILLGVRPEHMSVKEEASADSFAVELEVNEMMGSELHLHFNAVDGQKIITRIPTIDLSDEERDNLVYGHKTNVTFEGKVMHFFDPETHINILAE